VPESTAARTAPDARARILHVAAHRFATVGFDGAHLRAIAAEAGVTQPLIAYHFGSKGQLWKDAVDGVFSAAAADAGPPPAGGSPRTLAEWWIRTFVRVSARHPELNRIIMQEAKADSPRLDWIVERWIRPYHRQLVAVLDALDPPPPVVRAGPLHLHYVLTGAGAALFAGAPEARRLLGVDPIDPDVVERHADVLVELVLGPAPDDPDEET
jgi:AcrR family transcriptional regulator